MPYPLHFAEVVAIRAGKLPNAAVMVSKGKPGVNSGDGQLVSLMQTLLPRFCSWQRPREDNDPRSAQFAAAASPAQE